jgi:hypothetical protein
MFYVPSSGMFADRPVQAAGRGRSRAAGDGSETVEASCDLLVVEVKLTEKDVRMIGKVVDFLGRSWKPSLKRS